MTRWTFTSESVTEGHPDKMADQISDAVLDAIIAQDPTARVACETMVTTGLAMVAGEITTEAYVEIPKLVRETINGIGYDNAPVRLRRQHLRRDDLDRPAVARHRPGRGHRLRDPHRVLRRGRPQRPGRRRPGDDVRLRLRRDGRPHAAADLAGPPAGRAPGRGPQVRRPAVPAPGRQDPGDLRVRGRPPGAARHRAHLHPARAGHRLGDDDQARPGRAGDPPDAARAVRRRRLRRAA